MRLTSLRPLAVAVAGMLTSAFFQGQSRSNAWPAIAGLVGPYGGIRTVDDAKQMTEAGLTLTVLSSSRADILAALREGGAKYIDLFFWSQISERCRAQYAAENAAHRPLACSLSRDDQDAITQAAAGHLRQMDADPGLVAFWILDDDPHGDISGTLMALHSLVTQSNATSGFKRATICGIGGSLDAKTSAQDQRFTPNRGPIDRALANVSPGACDLVAPYFYGTARADDPRLIDWSMTDLMPYFLGKLRDKGFDTSAPLLVPVAHTFSYKGPNSRTFYVMPRPDDMAAQMAAYCDAGAFSMLFFTWESHDADRSYSNNDVIKTGVQKGRAECAKRWTH